MSTDNENLPKTKSKRKPKADKPLCTFPKCGPVKVLKEHIKKLSEEDAVLKQQLADRDVYIEEMEAKLRNLLGDLYAPSSERIHLATKDGVTVEDSKAESDPLDPPMSDGKKKRGAQVGHRGHGRKIPDSIPSIEVIHEIPEDQKICRECGLSYRDITLTEDSVEIDYEVKVILKKHRRMKAAKTCNCAVPTIITATKPPQIIPKGLFSTAFLALAIVQKYFFQIPLNRQIAQWEMNGLEVNAGTLVGCFKAIMVFLTPLYNLLIEVSRSQKHWHVDETRWLMFVEKPGKIGFRWWLWVFASKQVTVFVVDSSRSSKVPLKHFGDKAEGIINVDRYSAYHVLTVTGLIQRQLCWYHVRRDFIHAKEGSPALAAWAECWITDIHALDQLNNERVVCRHNDAMFAEKQAELESHLTQMTVKRDQQLESIGEKPLQLKILRSLKRNWDPLTVFVSNPDIPLHNNAAERAIRPATLGRKNYYGNHSEWCGEFAAMSMSILQTAAQNNLNIQAYLRYYLDACARLGKVPEDLANFLPWNIPEADRETLSLEKTKSS